MKQRGRALDASFRRQFPPTLTASEECPPRNVTFTKWFTADGFPWMTGVAGGAIGEGTFSGEVIAINDYGNNCANPTPGCLTFPVSLLEAIYDIHAGERSFTALIRGGASDRTGQGTLNGAIIDGWKAGASVQVEFQSLSSCDGNPAGPCFQGTIRIIRDSGE
jgi:hypothetical protein